MHGHIFGGFIFFNTKTLTKTITSSMKCEFTIFVDFPLNTQHNFIINFNFITCSFTVSVAFRIAKYLHIYWTCTCLKRLVSNGWDHRMYWKLRYYTVHASYSNNRCGRKFTRSSRTGVECLRTLVLQIIKEALHV